MTYSTPNPTPRYRITSVLSNGVEVVDDGPTIEVDTIELVIDAVQGILATHSYPSITIDDLAFVGVGVDGIVDSNSLVNGIGDLIGED